MNHIYISSCDKSGGIYRFELQNGKLLFKEKTAVDRPMYTVSRQNKLYVLLRETDPKTHFGGVFSFEIAKDGSLCNPSEVVSSRGLCPCHLAVTDDDIYVANYLSGNLISVKGKTDLHTGRGVNLPRQDGPHTHYVNLSPDGNYLLSCDLGLDSIFVYRPDLTVKSVAKVPDGEGARHLAYSPDGHTVYCVNELGSSVSAFGYHEGQLTLLDTCSAIQSTTENNLSAAIRYHDGYVYVSNRGEDTLVCFRAEEDRLEFVSRTPAGGSSPRDFDFCGDYLICTNETTDNITVFRSDKGTLTQTDEIQNVSHPLCVTVR